MRIKDVMTENPITVDVDTLVIDAQKLMKEKRIRRLCVTRKGKLVGIVTYHDLLRSSPSPATSLSVWEINYLWGKMKVSDVMTKDPLTVTPETTFEDALLLGQEKKIGSFPVMENGRLVGITTESDIIRLVARVLGLREEGSRITIHGLQMKLGTFSKIISVVDRHRVPILSMMSLTRPEQRDVMIVLRLKTKNPRQIQADLEEMGLSVDVS
ncbi:MAG: CBS domain-containing protein [Deltaproteobacteria bacterium]|nr:CBS domain-containing protein [Deltaproteobacteria bacterium]